MLREGDRVIAAVSGGPDSVCLLHCLVELAPEYGIELLAAHFNHKLRGEDSDRDEQFVEGLCKRLNVPLSLAGEDMAAVSRREKGSLEELCRKSRHGFLEGLAREKGFGKIALGHNLDDQAETVLMNVIRGTGIDGLKGIDPVRDCFIRPLIGIERKEIIDFLSSRGIPWRTDHSNSENSFRRNSIRNSLIPFIRENYNPSIVDALGRLANIARSENEFLDSLMGKAASSWDPLPGRGVKIPTGELLGHHPALRKRIIKSALEGLSPVKGGISHEHISAAIKVAGGKEPGASLDLPFGISARREYDFLVIEKRPAEGKPFVYAVPIPGTLMLAEAGMAFRFELMHSIPGNFGDSWRAYMDMDKIVHPLVFRNARPGDRIEPFGMEGKKKLQDVFTDTKVPRARRKHIPVLADACSVLWVPGVVSSRRTRVTANTGNVLSVEKI